MFLCYNLSIKRNFPSQYTEKTFRTSSDIIKSFFLEKIRQMKITNLKIGIRLAIGFGIVLMLTMSVGIRAIIEMQNLANDIVQIHEHSLAVSNAVRDIRANIIAMHRSMKDIALAKDIGQMVTVAATVDKYEYEVYQSFELVSQRFLGEQSDVKTAQMAFSDWKSIRDEVIRLMEFGEKDKAANITKGKGAKHVDEMNQKIQVMIDFSSNKANLFFENSQKNSQWAISLMIILLMVSLITSVIVAILITLSIVNPLNHIVKKIRNIAKGDLSQTIETYRHDEIGELSRSTYTMTQKLRDVSAEAQRQNWLKTGQTELNNAMRGDLNQSTLARKVITYLAKYLAVQVGTLYLYNEKKKELYLAASYAFKHRKGVNNIFKLGEGLVGQAALEQEMILMTDVPKDYVYISSGIGYTTPCYIIIAPIIYDNILKGVIELGTVHPFSDKAQQFLSIITENIAINISSAQSRYQMTELLEQSQRQTEELATQQDELKVTNDELEERTQELENNERSLQQQKEALEIANKQLLQTRQELEKKAEELEISSNYKSDFLANMSHELRTPLNSLLILSQQLTENHDENLTKEQLESVEIIYHAGQDLLNLINDILDLSKIEAGKMTLVLQAMSLQDFANTLKINFQSIADKKDLDFHINFTQECPTHIETDNQKLAQILKNLLSNAFKFTQKGSVTLDFQMVEAAIAITVIDTGIGIPTDKQHIIFEAFQQVDGSTSRQYGGTGLGLSISRELAKLLGGELHCSSIENEGSSFTLYFPFKKAKSEPILILPEITKTASIDDNQDKKNNFTNKKILLVDDDMRNLFALSGTFQRNGLSVYKAENGETALEILDREPSMDLILMDIMMPIMDGYETMRAIRLQKRFKDLPIIALTAKAMKDDRNKCLAAGANDYLTKPIDVNKLLSLIRVWLYK